MVYANESMGKMLGYTVEEFTALSTSGAAALVYCEDREIFFDRFKDRMEGEQAENITVSRREKRRFFSLAKKAFAALILYNGRPAVQAMFLNIDKRKKIEDACTKQASLIDLSPDAIIVKDIDDTVTFWSAGAEKLYGYTKKEAIGQKISILLKASFGESSEKIINQLKQGKNWTGEITHQTKNNNELIVQSYWSAKLDNQRNVVEILESNVDITERKKAEEAIKFQADLLNQVGQAVIMADNKKVIRFWNKYAEKLYGWTEEQAMGRKVTELLGGTPPGEVNRVTSRLKAGEGWSIEVLAKTKDGSKVPVILNPTPIYNQLGEYVGAASIATDISEQKRTEADLTIL